MTVHQDETIRLLNDLQTVIRSSDFPRHVDKPFVISFLKELILELNKQTAEESFSKLMQEHTKREHKQEERTRKYEAGEITYIQYFMGDWEDTDES